MSYSLVIEGGKGPRRILGETVPCRGDWIRVPMDGGHFWFPVIEVAHSLPVARRIKTSDSPWHVEHEGAEVLVFSSTAVAVPIRPGSELEEVKHVLPPTRWPWGGDASESGAARGRTPRGSAPQGDAPRTGGAGPEGNAPGHEEADGN